MDIKKWLMVGSCISVLGAFSACGDDSGSNPDVDPGLSSGIDPVPGSSGDNPTSSSAVTPGPVSSSVMTDADEPQMACSEIMYNAANGSEVEWVEIYIAGGMDIDNMEEFELHLSGAVDYSFPGEPLAKGEYVVVTNDLEKFREEYPAFTGRLFGPWNGGTAAKLPNDGDVVNVKIRGEGDVTCAFSNEPPWPSLADGKGRSLVYNGVGNAAQPSSWSASKLDKGNPGVGNDEAVTPASVRINEIMPTAAGVTAWMELYNTGTEAVDVTGWTLNIKRRGQTLTLKKGVVPAKGYLLLDGATDFADETGAVKELVVSNTGGEFYLRGSLEGEESSIWVPANTGASGVVDLADGSTAQGPLATPTPGAANSALKRGSVYINEIHYHPALDGTGFWFEFMEIVNDGDTDVSLVNSQMNPSKGWKVEGINLEFSSLAFVDHKTVLPAHSMMVLLPDTDAVVRDTAFLREKYGVDPSVKFAIYHGKLSNRGETIAIKEPFSVEGAGLEAKYFFVWHDATLYSDNWPGLEEADGGGFSLQRVDVTTMGYESSAWKAAEPTFGKM